MTTGTPTALPSTRLTKTEEEVLRAVLAGKTSAQVAKERWLNIKTIDAHMAHIRRKLGCSESCGSSREGTLSLLTAALERYGLSILGQGSPLRSAIEATAWVTA